MIKHLKLYYTTKSLYFILGVFILINLIYYKLIIIRLPKDISNIYYDICLFIILSYCTQLISLMYMTTYLINLFRIKLAFCKPVKILIKSLRNIYLLENSNIPAVNKKQPIKFHISLKVSTLLILSILLLSTINHNSMNMAIASLFLCMTPKYYYKRTPLTRALSIRVLKRYTGSAKKILEKGKECVGDNCKETLQALATVNPNNTPTASAEPANNAAHNLQKSPNSVDANLPAINITHADATPSKDVPYFPQEDTTKTDVKKAVKESYYNDTNNKIVSTTDVSSTSNESHNALENSIEEGKDLVGKAPPLPTPYMDALKKQGFNLTNESPTVANSSNQDSKPSTTSGTNKIIDTFLSKYSIVQNQSTQEQSKGSTTSNSSTQSYSSNDTHTNSVSLSNDTEEPFNNEISSRDIPNSPLPKTTSTEQSTSMDSELTSPSFNEDSESVKETEDLIEKALDMNLIVRRDAPKNPNAGSEHMTVIGNSLYNELQVKKDVQVSQNPIDLSNTTFQTGILTIDENQTLIPRADQIHLVITNDNQKIYPVITDDNGKTYAWGYLTSLEDSSTFKIADKQLDAATKTDGTFKPQFYKPFAQPIEISSEQFTTNYDGDAYLQNPEIIEQLNYFNSKTGRYEPIPYKEVGLTKEELQAMIAEMDIDKSEKDIKEAKKPSNFLDDDKKKKTKKSQEAAQKNQEKQKKESQEKKAKAEIENKLKSSPDDQ